MFRAASFDGQFALLVARHLYFLFFVIIVLLHLANKICSVLYFQVPRPHVDALVANELGASHL